MAKKPVSDVSFDIDQYIDGIVKSKSTDGYKGAEKIAVEHFIQAVENLEAVETQIKNKEKELELLKEQERSKEKEISTIRAWKVSIGGRIEALVAILVQSKKEREERPEYHK